MKVTSLFSGCGGLDLGLRNAGHEIIMQVESDPSCRQVLRHHFPGTLLQLNVEHIEKLPPETDVLAAGFPCQDLSPESSTRKGLKGTKTSMVRHVFRLLKASRPVPWVVLENVPGLLDRIHKEPAMMGFIAKHLELLGYSWAYRIINTAGFGDPQRRRRVFVVASLQGDPRDALLAEVGSCGSPCTMPCVLCWESSKDLDQEVHAVDLECWRSGGCVGIMPTLTKSNGSRWMILTPGHAAPPGLLAIGDAERLQGFESGYTWPCLRGEGVARDLTTEAHERARFALVGDAVSVPVAWYIGKRIANPYSGLKYTHGRRDRPFDPATQETWPRAAWRLAGDLAPQEATGLLSNGALAELPQLLPFKPLSKFLTAIRPGLKNAAVSNYVARLKGNQFELSQNVQLKLICTYGLKLNDFQTPQLCIQSPANTSLSNTSDLKNAFLRFRPKWYPAILQSREHASPSVLAEEGPGKILVLFKGEQNKWSSLWVDKVVPWLDRCAEEVSDKMDLPDEYARLVAWAGAEYNWLCRFNGNGEYKASGEEPRPSLKRKVDNVASPMLGSTLLQGHELVGRHLDVYWPADDSFYEAVVESYNPQNKEPYKIVYDVDGQWECLDLRQVQWRLLPRPFGATSGASSLQEEYGPTETVPCTSSSRTLRDYSMQPPAQAECGFQASGSASSAKGEQPFAVQNLASGDTLIKCSAGYGSQQDGENVHPVEGYSEEQHLPHARGDPQRLSASQEDPAQVTSTSPASKRGTPSMTLLLTTDPIEAGQETTNTPVHLADFSAATSICPNDPHRIPSLAGLDKDKIAAEQIIKTGRLPKASRLLASHQRHNIITSIDVSSSPMIEFVEATSADSAPVRDLTRPDQAGYNGLFPDPRPDPAQEDTTRVGGITQLLLKPFEQNDAFQEAAWRTALETTSRIKLPKHGKLRRAPAPRRAVTEAALLRNPALNGAAFVGRHVKLLDLRTRLWMLATVVSFNDTIGFRNTLPWLVRYADGSEEFVNLCLGLCQLSTQSG